MHLGSAMNDWRRWAVRLTAALLLGFFAWHVSRVPDDVYTHIEGEAFATQYRITYAFGPNQKKVQRAVDAELSRIDAMASTWREDSELTRYNRATDPAQFALSPELSGLIAQAKQIETQTGGAFSLRPNGETVDLSGIAKGYAVDRIVELLQAEFGVTDCLVDIGGEVRAIGDGPKGEGWRVGLYLPMDAVDIDAPVLQLRDASVATSGAYFKGDHILDPSTGKPVENNLLSATVIHDSNTAADALATALYVMGPEQGIAWAKEQGIWVIFLLKDGTHVEHQPQ